MRRRPNRKRSPSANETALGRRIGLSKKMGNFFSFRWVCVCWSSFFGSTNGSRVLISRSDATGHLGRRKLHDSGNQAADVSMIICRRSLVNHFSFTFPTCVCCIDVDCIGARCTANHSISFLIWLRRHQAAPNGNSIFFSTIYLKLTNILDMSSRWLAPPLFYLWEKNFVWEEILPVRDVRKAPAVDFSSAERPLANTGPTFSSRDAAFIKSNEGLAAAGYLNIHEQKVQRSAAEKWPVSVRGAKLSTPSANQMKFSAG